VRGHVFGVLTGGDGGDTVNKGDVVCVPLVVLVGLGVSVCDAWFSTRGVALLGSLLLGDIHKVCSLH